MKKVSNLRERDYCSLEKNGEFISEDLTIYATLILTFNENCINSTMFTLNEIVRIGLGSKVTHALTSHL